MPWTDTYPEMRAAINDQIGAGGDDARRLVEAGEQLWAVLEALGMVDDFGSTESHRVFPAALAFIRETANRGPYLEVPGDWS